MTATRVSYTPEMVGIALAEVDNLQQRLQGHHWQAGDWAATWRLQPYYASYGYAESRDYWTRNLYVPRDVAELKSVTMNENDITSAYLSQKRIIAQQLGLPFYGTVEATVTLVDDTPLRKAQAIRAALAYMDNLRRGVTDVQLVRDALLDIDGYTLNGIVPDILQPVGGVAPPTSVQDIIYGDISATENANGFAFIGGVAYGEGVPMPNYAGEGYVRLAQRSTASDITYISILPLNFQNLASYFTKHSRAAAHQGTDYDIYVSQFATTSSGRTFTVRR